MLNEILESPLGDSIKAMSHITGGGIAANLARVLPKNTTLDIERSSWAPHEVFQVLVVHSFSKMKRQTFQQSHQNHRQRCRWWCGSARRLEVNQNLVPKCRKDRLLANLISHCIYSCMVVQRVFLLLALLA